MYNSFNISMDFELHGVKFNYEYGNVYRLYEYARKGNEWKQIKIGKSVLGYPKIQFRKNNKHHSYLLHRIVYWLHNPDWDFYNPKLFIDHIDRQVGNCDISNLRLVTPEENCFNTNAKGCCWNKQKQKWCAYIRVKKKLKHLGVFELEEDAHQAYIDAKEIYHII